MAASCEAEDTLRLKNAFQKCFDKLRAGLQLEVKSLNSILYSKGLISGEVRMKSDIDTTLSAISIRLENTDVTKSTFFGFTKAVSQIDSKMHLKTMLEYHANDSTDRDITAAGVHRISGTGSSEQAWQKDLETSRDSAMSTITDSVRSVSWRQVLDEENSHSHSADHHSESGNMPNVSVEYFRELEEKRITTLEATIQAMEAHNLKQAQYEEVREKAHKDNTRLTEERILQAEEKARQAEKKARQAAERAFQAEKQLNACQLNEDDQDFEKHRQAEEGWEEEEAHQQDEEEWEEEETHQQDEEEWEEEARQRDEWEEEARQRDEWEEEARQRDEYEEEARQQDEEEEARQRDEYEEEARQQDEEEF